MAIIHMASTRDASEGRIIPGAYSPFEWLHDEAVSTGNSDIKLREAGSAMFLYKTHHGLCISEREANFHDDSDFYMLVWDEAAQAPHEIMFASTRGWSYPCLGSSADATPETLAAYAAWRQRECEAAVARQDRAARREIVIECLHLVHTGAVCRVARGRKIPKGTQGTVIGLSKRPDYMGVEMELWALLDVGNGFTSVLAKHLDIVRHSPKALQLAFDMAC